jgi:alpha-mannosidase
MKLGNSSVAELDIRTPQISVLAGGRVVGSGSGIPDQGGEERFLQRFALGTHGAYDPVSAMKFAMEHQNPLSVGEIRGEGPFPADQYSSLAIDNPNVLVWALKPAEDGIDSGFIVRLWNVSQSKQDFVLQFGGGIQQAFHLTHVETPVGEAAVQNGALVDALNPQQLKTYALFAERLESASITPMAPAATAAPGGSVSATLTPATVIESASSTPTVAPVATPVATPAPEGKGCLLGLLDVLFTLLK